MTTRANTDAAFKKHCIAIGEYTRNQYRRLRKCESRPALETIWGDILIHRLALQEYCEELILSCPEQANDVSADRFMWKYVYYDAITECRKRLRLHVPLHDLSHTSSITGSMRSSDRLGSTDGSMVRSSRANSEGPLEEWQEKWWTMTLATLFNEALGYFQCLYSRMSSRLEASPLVYAKRYLNSEQYRLPPAYMIARRLYMYIGDVYRYQFMYLPLLSYGNVGPIDATEILKLARWTYGRASAMFFDNGRANIQIAILSTYSHSLLNAVFWHMCSMCYAESSPGSRKRGMSSVSAAYAKQELTEVSDPIESLIIKFSQAVITGGGSSSVVFTVYEDLLAEFNADLDEITNSPATLNLDADFWVREYQLSVILGSLLTVVSEYPTWNAESQRYLLCIQHLALTLLLRQALCLQQTLDIGEADTPSTVYPLISLALWIDIWRSTPHLTETFKFASEVCPEFGQSAESFFDCLVRLVRNYSDYGLTAHHADQYAEMANGVLPHDLSLMGWMSLRAVQRRVRYQIIDTLPLICPSAAGSPMLAGNAQIKCTDADANGEPLSHLWSDTANVMSVVFARAQELILAEATRDAMPFLGWDSAQQLVVGTSELPSEAEHPENEQNNTDSANASLSIDKESADSTNTAQHLLWPLRIPDVDIWCSHLSAVQEWLELSTFGVLLTNNVHQELFDLKNSGDGKILSSNAAAALQLIHDYVSKVDSPLVIQQLPGDALDKWEDANVFLQYDEDEDVPVAEDVPRTMRDILSCAIRLADTRYSQHGVEIVTDDEELGYYASWFGIQCMPSAVYLFNDEYNL
ncbi:hypothetical protein LPJ66_000852 [Kickxella alabastrina]|uniref:Uncharacterized protein n=1 Tax=Kickxella alabastrina TaxID=61397 RepID=A0ACC1IV29_9FUNG|nr:hypothetical protein LPJ66_000852 [Kickxella alabastrina]